ncbi:hypothetical protein [Vibrio viridaestus]|uniref:Uncharacterized protein n=1 Tax=Vibrio viridaestus TaxID=2487322 RepID=A0A3N9TII2_9VIBR|nr:hypothetical protein [Vibrio viridaestus]RQW64019.1 hypothetical protein EES38_05285 [Vibrio viridaestus]
MRQYPDEELLFDVSTLPGMRPFPYDESRISQISIYYPYFDGINNYIGFDAVTLTGDFEWSADVQCDATLGIGYLFSSTVNTGGRFVLYFSSSDNSWRFFSSNDSSYSTTYGANVTDDSFIDGGVHTIKCKRVSGVVSYYIENNQTAVASYSDNGADYTINGFGNKFPNSGIQYFNGVSNNLVIGEHLFALNESWSEYPTAKDSNNNGDATYYNFTEDQVLTEIS